MGKWRRILDLVTPVKRRIGRLEALAEAAYGAMYEAAPHSAKDCYEDAMLHLHQAEQLAGKADMQDAVARLKARAEHIRNVYNHQFRYVGR